MASFSGSIYLQKELKIDPCIQAVTFSRHLCRALLMSASTSSRDIGRKISGTFWISGVSINFGHLFYAFYNGNGFIGGSEPGNPQNNALGHI